MLHACVRRFDVMGTIKFFLELNRADRATPCWKAPGAARIKVNVDGAFTESRKSSYGVVIRDEKGAALL